MNEKNAMASKLGGVLTGVKLLKQAKEYMNPGQFHRAAGILEYLGCPEGASVANSAAGADFLIMGKYVSAAFFFRKAGRYGFAEAIELTCTKAGIDLETSMELECSPPCIHGLTATKPVRNEKSFEEEIELYLRQVISLGFIESAQRYEI